jgi:hypothetical protein
MQTEREEELKSFPYINFQYYVYYFLTREFSTFTRGFYSTFI